MSVNIILSLPQSVPLSPQSHGDLMISFLLTKYVKLNDFDMPTGHAVSMFFIHQILDHRSGYGLKMIDSY